MNSATISAGVADDDWETTTKNDTLCVIRISIAELNIQKVLQARVDDLVWNLKLKLLSTIGKELKDGLNYGLYFPPQGGKAGKFLDEERPLRDYPFSEAVGYLEFKYKRRVYKLLQVNPKKLKQLHTKANLKQFMSAVQSGDIDKINKFAMRGIDPNFHDRDLGETPLTLACATKKSREVILTLVAAGAHIDFRNKEGYTPMHRAASMGHTDTILTLLELGASANYKDAFGLTPLYLCVCSVTPAACAELLLHDRAVLDVRDSAGWTETHQACKAGRVQHLEHLLFYGADMNAQHNAGNTPLHVCALNNQESCARVLLFRGADRNIQNYSNQTAFQIAVLSGHFDLAEIIRKFSDDDIVPFQEMPHYNEKRRSVIPAMGQLQRCRSNPNLNLLLAGSSKPPSPALSNNSLPQYSDSMTSTPRGNIRLTPPGSLSTGSASSLAGRPKSLIEETPEFFTLGPRTVILQKGQAGFGFVLRGLKCKSNIEPTGFSPTPNFPSLQCLQQVDMGGVAEKAGLKAGDFILEVNSVDVTKSSHDIAVNLIRQSGDTVMMKVVTVSSSSAASANDDSPFMYPTLPLKRAPSSKSNGQISLLSSTGQQNKSKFTNGHSKSNGGLKSGSQGHTSNSKQTNIMIDDRPINGRGWLDRPMTGFGRMRAAISCGDLSRGSELLSVYGDNDDDEDLSTYSTLSDRLSATRQKQQLETDIINEQTGKKISVSVVTDSPASLRFDPEVRSRGRDSSTNSELSYRTDWLSNYSEQPIMSRHLESSLNADSVSKLSAPISSDDNFDVDSLIVPCPPSFSNSLPPDDIPFIIPPPPVTDDMEGELIPINLQEYASGNDSVRSRSSARSSTRNAERISTFFASPTNNKNYDGSLIDSDLHLAAIPPPPLDEPAISVSRTTHSNSRSFANSKNELQSHSLRSMVLSTATSMTSLTLSNDVSLDSSKLSSLSHAQDNRRAQSSNDVDPSHAALLAAIAKRRQVMENLSDEEREEDSEMTHHHSFNESNAQRPNGTKMQPLDDNRTKQSTTVEAFSGNKAKLPNTTEVFYSNGMKNSRNDNNTGIKAQISESIATSSENISNVKKLNSVAPAVNKIPPGNSTIKASLSGPENISNSAKGIFVMRASPNIPLSHTNSPMSNGTEETESEEDFLSMAEKVRQQWLQQQKSSPSSTLTRPATKSQTNAGLDNVTANNQSKVLSPVITAKSSSTNMPQDSSTQGSSRADFEKSIKELEEEAEFLPPPPDIFLSPFNAEIQTNSEAILPHDSMLEKSYVKEVEINIRPSDVKTREAAVRKPQLVSDATANRLQNIDSRHSVEVKDKQSKITSNSLISAKSALRPSVNGAILNAAASVDNNQDVNSPSSSNSAVTNSNKKPRPTSVPQTASSIDCRLDGNFASVIAAQAANKQKKLDVIVDGKGSIRKSQLTGQRVVYSSASRFGQVVSSDNKDASKNKSLGVASSSTVKSGSNNLVSKPNPLSAQHRFVNNSANKETTKLAETVPPPPPEFYFDFEAPGRVFIEDSTDTLL